MGHPKFGAPSSAPRNFAGLRSSNPLTLGAVKLRLLSILFASTSVILSVSTAFGQGSSPLITVAPISAISVARGEKVSLDIALRVNQGFHVNSNHPNDELLLPTVVRLDTPEGVTVARLDYPDAEQLVLPFAGNEKLSVYSGDFAVSAEMRVAKTAALGAQHVRGEVRYQACDNRRCFPPKTTPIEFDLNVTDAKPKNRHAAAAVTHAQ
jgi:thiol:disulfide interchange protein DsbD